MLPDRVSNPGPLTYESGALPIALRGPTQEFDIFCNDCLDALLTSLSDVYGLYKMFNNLH